MYKIPLGGGGGGGQGGLKAAHCLEGKDQESKQSSTTPDPGHHMGKWQKHIQASQEFSHFSAGDHKAAMKRQESVTNTKLSLNTFSFLA